MVAAIAVSASGCYGTLRTYDTGPTPAAGASIDVDYEPTYYDDYVVYYDDGGVPYYYVNGTVRYVPRSDVRFNVYVDNYRRHGSAYRRWSTNARRAHVERREHWERQHRAHRRR